MWIEIKQKFVLYDLGGPVGGLVAATSKTHRGGDYAVSSPVCVVIVNATSSRTAIVVAQSLQLRRFP